MKSSTSLDRFIEFIYASQPTDENDCEALVQDLEAIGVDVRRVRGEVAKILTPLRVRTAGAGRLPWVERARGRLAMLDKQAKTQAELVIKKYKNRDALLEAVFSGQLGTSVQVRAVVFFRNKKTTDISENELRSFVEDCELLELL